MIKDVLKSFAFDWEIDEKLMIFTNRREMKCHWKFGIDREKYWGLRTTYIKGRASRAIPLFSAIDLI